jgi:hypothetical protein
MNQPPGLGGPPGLPGGNQGLTANNAGGGHSNASGGGPPGLPPGLGLGGGGGVPGGPPGLSLSPLPTGQNQGPGAGQNVVSPGGGQPGGPGSYSNHSPIHGFVQPQLFPQPSLGPPNTHPTPNHAAGHPSHHQSGSVSTIVKAQIVFLLSTLTEDSWERNVSEIRTLISQNSPEMYHHFLKRLIVVAAPVIQSLQSQAAGIQQSQQQAGQGMIPGDRPLQGNLSVPQNGPGVLAWRVLQSEGLRAARDSNLGKRQLTNRSLSSSELTDHLSSL